MFSSISRDHGFNQPEFGVGKNEPKGRLQNHIVTQKKDSAKDVAISSTSSCACIFFACGLTMLCIGAMSLNGAHQYAHLSQAAAAVLVVFGTGWTLTGLSSCSAATAAAAQS